MNRHAQWIVVCETPESLTIRDIGVACPSVTNDAEQVVIDLAPRLGGRRLFYYDSEGQLDELVVRDGHFAGFRLEPR